MADIVSEIIDDIQSDIDSGYYDPDTFDIYDAIWETLNDKLIYTHKIIKYWESIPGYASDEITRLMTEEITEYVSGSISESDFSLPGDFTANRRAFRKRAMDAYTTQTLSDNIFEFYFNNSQDEFDEIYEDDTHLVYEIIERYLDETGEEYDDYDVTDIASFIAGGNSDW